MYVGSYNGRIFSISPNGIRNWFFQTGDSVLSFPTIDNNCIIYCGSLDGNLYALNPDDSPLWKINTGNSIESSPIIGEEGIIYITNWGVIFTQLIPSIINLLQYQLLMAIPMKK